MLYNMFCIFIGVTFANLGREGRESGKMRDPICYRTKENSYINKKMHRLITSQCIKLKLMIVGLVLF